MSSFAQQLRLLQQSISSGESPLFINNNKPKTNNTNNTNSISNNNNISSNGNRPLLPIPTSNDLQSLLNSSRSKKTTSTTPTSTPLSTNSPSLTPKQSTSSSKDLLSSLSSIVNGGTTIASSNKRYTTSNVSPTPKLSTSTTSSTVVTKPITTTSTTTTSTITTSPTSTSIAPNIQPIDVDVDEDVDEANINNNNNKNVNQKKQELIEQQQPIKDIPIVEREQSSGVNDNLNNSSYHSYDIGGGFEEPDDHHTDTTSNSRDIDTTINTIDSSQQSSSSITTTTILTINNNNNINQSFKESSIGSSDGFMFDFNQGYQALQQQHLNLSNNNSFDTSFNGGLINNNNNNGGSKEVSPGKAIIDIDQIVNSNHHAIHRTRSQFNLTYLDFDQLDEYFETKLPVDGIDGITNDIDYGIGGLGGNDSDEYKKFLMTLQSTADSTNTNNPSSKESSNLINEDDEDDDDYVPPEEEDDDEEDEDHDKDGFRVFIDPQADIPNEMEALVTDFIENEAKDLNNNDYLYLLENNPLISSLTCNTPGGGNNGLNSIVGSSSSSSIMMSPPRLSSTLISSSSVMGTPNNNLNHFNHQQLLLTPSSSLTSLVPMSPLPLSTLSFSNNLSTPQSSNKLNGVQVHSGISPQDSSSSLTSSTALFNSILPDVTSVFQLETNDIMFENDFSSLSSSSNINNLHNHQYSTPTKLIQFQPHLIEDTPINPHNYDINNIEQYIQPIDLFTPYNENSNNSMIINGMVINGMVTPTLDMTSFNDNSSMIIAPFPIIDSHLTTFNNRFNPILPQIPLLPPPQSPLRSRLTSLKNKNNNNSNNNNNNSNNNNSLNQSSNQSSIISTLVFTSNDMDMLKQQISNHYQLLLQVLLRLRIENQKMNEQIEKQRKRKLKKRNRLARKNGNNRGGNSGGGGEMDIDLDGMIIQLDEQQQQRQQVMILDDEDEEETTMINPFTSCIEPCKRMLDEIYFNYKKHIDKSFLSQMLIQQIESPSKVMTRSSAKKALMPHVAQYYDDDCLKLHPYIDELLREDLKPSDESMEVIINIFVDHFDPQLTFKHNNLNRLKFSHSEDLLLKLGLERYGHDWHLIKKHLLPTKSIDQICHRFKNKTTQSSKDNVIKEFQFSNKLTKEDEELIIKGVKEFGQEWEKIMEKYLPTKNVKAIALFYEKHKNSSSNINNNNNNGNKDGNNESSSNNNNGSGNGNGTTTSLSTTTKSNSSSTKRVKSSLSNDKDNNNIKNNKRNNNNNNNSNNVHKPRVFRQSINKNLLQLVDVEAPNQFHQFICNDDLGRDKDNNNNKKRKKQQFDNDDNHHQHISQSYDNYDDNNNEPDQQQQYDVNNNFQIDNDNDNDIDNDNNDINNDNEYQQPHSSISSPIINNNTNNSITPPIINHQSSLSSSPINVNPPTTVHSIGSSVPTPPPLPPTTTTTTTSATDKVKWTREEDKILLMTVKERGTGNNDMNQVWKWMCDNNVLPTKTMDQINSRYQHLLELLRKRS